MFETLGATIKMGLGQPAAAREQLAQAVRDFPGRFYLEYALAESMQSTGEHQSVVDLAERLARQRPRDARVHGLLARSHAALGRRALQHRSQAEVYALAGAWPAAIEQLQIARSSTDADFFVQSAADVRIRELRALLIEEKKNPPRF
jgi:beta-barrel assembly-enhancing protease